MTLLAYFRVWLACARYSVVRTMMFRFDFLMWALVELFWMGVNILLISVIYQHTEEIAGWTKYQMLLLVGTSMIVQRLLMGFFWSNLFELGRNIRSGHFDFFLAQPGTTAARSTTGSSPTASTGTPIHPSPRSRCCPWRTSPGPSPS
jgi:ABC-2 type transport system permease protein